MRRDVTRGQSDGSVSNANAVRADANENPYSKTIGAELFQPSAIGNVMRPRIRDLTVLLNADGAVLERAGAAVIAHERLPHPVLHLIEELYPREVARARFSALWSERDSSAPDPRTIGCHFKVALVNALKVENVSEKSMDPPIRDYVPQA
jgi:hypothetical protein